MYLTVIPFKIYLLSKMSLRNVPAYLHLGMSIFKLRRIGKEIWGGRVRGNPFKHTYAYTQKLIKKNRLPYLCKRVKPPWGTTALPIPSTRNGNRKPPVNTRVCSVVLFRCYFDAALPFALLWHVRRLIPASSRGDTFPHKQNPQHHRRLFFLFFSPSASRAFVFSQYA